MIGLLISVIVPRALPFIRKNKIAFTTFVALCFMFCEHSTAQANYYMKVSSSRGDSVAYINLCPSGGIIDTVRYYMSVKTASDSITAIKANVALKYDASNPSAYISSVPAQTFTSLTGKPTTLAGYSISDAYSSSNPSAYISSITSGNVTTALGFIPVTNARTITINGSAQDLSANRTWSVGTLVGADSTTFRANSNALYSPKFTLTTTGTSGAATYSANVLNIPQYAYPGNAKADNATKGIASFDSAYHTDDGAGNIKFAIRYGTGTVSANAVTINQPRGRMTLAAPGLAASTNLSITLTNSYITTTSNIQLTINGNGSSITIPLFVYIKTQSAGSCVINLLNISLLSLFNSAVTIDYVVFN